MTQPPLQPADRPDDRPDQSDADERRQPPAASEQPGYMPPGYQPPGYQQQPYGQQPYGWNAQAAPAVRPGITTAAAIVLIVLGVLTAILGLFALLAASIFASGMEIPGIEQLGDNAAGAIGGVIAIFGGVFIVFGILQVVSGINVFSAKGWARILGIVLAVISALFGLLALLGSGEPGANSSPIVGLILLAANAFVIWALATNGRYFTR